MIRTVYLDHHATTPLDPRAFEAMKPYFTEEFGNASSATHDWGHRAAEAVAVARASVARLIGARPSEIVFTGGATEANNLALKGAARMARREGRGSHLVTTAIEHKAVLLTMRALAEEGFALTVVPPDAKGIVSADAVGEAMRDDTVVVSVMAANSEIGTVQPVEGIGAVCAERGALFHTDATQLVGKLPVDVGAMRCDLLSLSAHKFYGPKGVGALYVRRGTPLEPILHGGGQEGGLRSGTLNVPGIVGMGAVADLRLKEMEDESRRLTELRDEFWGLIKARVPDAVLNGCTVNRLPGNLHVSFPRCEGEALMLQLEEYALSSGSACQSAKKAPSEVLTAIGLDANLASSSVRFGLGKSTRREQLHELADRIAESVKRLQRLAPETV